MQKPVSYGWFCTYFDVHKAAWVFLFPSSENLGCWLAIALPLMTQLFGENMWHFPLLLIFNVQLKAVSSYLLSELSYPCSNVACRSSMRKYNCVNIYISQKCQPEMSQSVANMKPILLFTVCKLLLMQQIRYNSIELHFQGKNRTVSM